MKPAVPIPKPKMGCLEEYEVMTLFWPEHLCVDSQRR